MRADAAGPRRRPDAPSPAAARHARWCSRSPSARAPRPATPARPARPACGPASESPGPKLAAGMPAAANRLTSVQPSFARTSQVVAIAQASRAAGGQPRRRGVGHVDHLDHVALLEERGEHLLDVGLRLGRAVRSGANRWLIVTTARSGTTLPATPPSTNTACSASRNSHPSSTGSAPLVVVERRQHPAGPVDGVAAHPRPGRVGRAPASVTRSRIVPWHPTSSGAAGGLAQQRRRRPPRGRALLEQVAQPVVHGGHLLAGVEHPGDVDRRVRHRRRPARA